MNRKTNYKKCFLFGIFFILIVTLPYYYIQTYAESVYTEGFPIPGNVDVVNISGKHQFESYNWNGASDENGLPLRYKIVIRLAGWKAVDKFGAMTTYEKNNVKIEVISSTNMIDLYSNK